MHFVRHTLHEFVYARYVLMTRWKNVKTKIFLQRKNCCLKLPEELTDTLYIYHNFSELNFGTKIARFE